MSLDGVLIQGMLVLRYQSQKSVAHKASKTEHKVDYDPGTTTLMSSRD